MWGRGAVGEETGTGAGGQEAAAPAVTAEPASQRLHDFGGAGGGAGGTSDLYWNQPFCTPFGEF